MTDNTFPNEFDQAGHKVHILKHFKLFQDATDQEMAMVASICQERNYQTGAILFDVDDVGNDLYLVVSGALAVDLKVDKGAYRRDAYHIYRYEMFGELVLFDQKRSTRIRVAEPAALLAIPGQQLRSLMAQHRNLCCLFMTYISGILVERLKLSNLRETDMLSSLDNSGSLVTDEMDQRVLGWFPKSNQFNP